VEKDSDFHYYACFVRYATVKVPEFSNNIICYKRLSKQVLIKLLDNNQAITAKQELPE